MNRASLCIFGLDWMLLLLYVFFAPLLLLAGDGMESERNIIIRRTKFERNGMKGKCKEERSEKSETKIVYNTKSKAADDFIEREHAV